MIEHPVPFPRNFVFTKKITNNKISYENPELVALDLGVQDYPVDIKMALLLHFGGYSPVGLQGYNEDSLDNLLESERLTYEVINMTKTKVIIKEDL